MKNTILLNLIVLLAASALAPAATRLVPDEYATIQAAIDDCNDGDVVIVAPGTYTGEGNRDIDFKGKTITAQSESGPENCIIDCQNSGGGFFFHSGETANSVIDGFTITNGRWGGICCRESSPTISNCNISNCWADRGGGIDCRDNSSPAISNCTITRSMAGLGGGIACRYGSNATINNCTIIGNIGYDAAGGIWCTHSAVTLINCTVIGNVGAQDGGGISCQEATLTATNCTFADNSAPQGNFLACVFWHDDPSHVNISNCIISNGGDEILNENDSVITINYSNIQNGWEGEGNIDADPGFVQPGYWDANGTPNEPGDDFWVDGDYHLWEWSECVDTGTNNPSGGLPETDLDGKTRPFDGDADGIAIADMGAYEYPIACDEPVIKAKPQKFGFFAMCDCPGPEAQVMQIWNPGVGTLHWEIAEDCDWLEAVPTNGVSTGQINEVTLTVDPNGLAPGDYSCIIRVLDPNAINSPVTVQVALRIRVLLRVPEQFPTIQAAIDAAVDYDVVLVADGTYSGEGNRDIDFRGKVITVRSENGPQNCIIDCNGTEADPHRGFYFHNGEEANSVLAGFTIINGYADKGGGIYCSGSSPTITNCTITGNTAKRGGGGGIFCKHGSPTITNCNITKNGDIGIDIDYDTHSGDVIITNCTITENEGAGIDYDGYFGDVIITDCTIAENGDIGIGIDYDGYFGDIIITNCTIVGNADSAIDYDGYGCDIIITNCTITENGNRGIDYDGYGCNIIITNCTIAENGGDGIYCHDGDAIITNCTITGNEYAGIMSHGDDAIITNSIVYNNSYSYPDYPQIEIDAASTVTYSNVQGSWLGLGNIDIDPCFVSPGWLEDNNTPDDPHDDRWVGGDYHLLENSLCINAGDPNYLPVPSETDLDGLPRVIAGRIDMGAYEFNHIPVADAGPDQTVYAWIDGIAEVTLDGSGSYDDDGQTLTYLWSWTVDGNSFTATGGDGIVNMLDFTALAKQWLQTGNLFADIAPPGGDGVVDILDLSILTEAWLSTPALSNWNSQCDIAPTGAILTIELPIGEHIIELVVNDGIDDSEPDEVIITVVGPIEGELWVFPQIIRRHSPLKKVMALVHLPEGVTKDQIDSDQPLLLYPGGIEASHQWVIGKCDRVKVFALFDKAELMDAVPDSGSVELQVVGQLRTGQYFYGTDTIRIIGWH